MNKLLTYSLLSLCLGFSMASYGIGATASYFTDVEVSVTNTITTGEWVIEPTVKDDCKKGGFEELTDPDTNEIYKNQGQCVSDTVPEDKDKQEDEVQEVILYTEEIGN